MIWFLLAAAAGFGLIFVGSRMYDFIQGALLMAFGTGVFLVGIIGALVSI